MWSYLDNPNIYDLNLSKSHFLFFFREPAKKFIKEKIPRKIKHKDSNEKCGMGTFTCNFPIGENLLQKKLWILVKVTYASN